MSYSDTIGDTMTRIRNGQLAKLRSVIVLYSKVNLAILQLLKQEGYILDFSVQDVRRGVKTIVVMLKYYRGIGVIKEIKRISKPGRRVFIRASRVHKFYNGLGMLLISTARKGIISDYEALKLNVGGEVLGGVF